MPKYSAGLDNPNAKRFRMYRKHAASSTVWEAAVYVQAFGLKAVAPFLCIRLSTPRPPEELSFGVSMEDLCSVFIGGFGGHLLGELISYYFRF